MSQPPWAAVPSEGSDEPQDAQTDPEEFGSGLGALRPNPPADFPFPSVLPEDPAEMDEVLRRFAEWDAQRREFESRIVASAYPADTAPESSARTYDLAERMRELGAPDPESWANSELAENIPQEARWLLVRAIWKAIDEFQPGSASFQTSVLVQRLVAAGADAEDLSKALRYAAFSGVFGTLVEIDTMIAMDAPRDAPGWRLVETRVDPDGDDYVPTGRHVGGLHESLSQADPSGRGGADLFE